MPSGEILTIIPAVIGAVFGGAVFGDHCSPFSDTTIVSATASGCETTKHVHSQLPFAAMAAGYAAVSYSFIAFGLSPWIATALAALLMVLNTILLAKRALIILKKNPE
jgi:Na+/H+ antiporter NhaC